MNSQQSMNTGPDVYAGYRSIKFKLKVIFSCLTAVPFFVFAYIYFNIGGFGNALSGFLVALVLILVLEGYMIFRKMADHVEQLSSTMTQAAEGKLRSVQDDGGTRELAMIADTFNSTLFKLEDTAKELGVKAVQAATLNEIREIVSTSIDLEEIAKVILTRTIRAVDAKAGYIAVKRNDSPALHVAASLSMTEGIPEKIELDVDKTLAGLVFHSNSPILIEDIEQEPHLKDLNWPAIGAQRLLYLSIVVKGNAVGVLVLGRDRAQPNFGDEDMHFLQTVLQQVAYSVENARLYENLEHSNTELANALKAQKEAQSQLLASARMAAFGELSVNIAHELNNPLTGILGYTDLLLSSSANNAQTEELLEKIRAQVVRASNITGSLLDFVTVDSGSSIKTDINRLVKKAVFLAEGRMHKEGIHLDLKLAEQPVPVMANPAQMGQVFYNLISNALNAVTGAFRTSEGSDARDSETEGKHRLLSIQSAKRGDKVYVSFKDTGPGITSENLSRIFEPFYSSQNKVSQVGLGLWVSSRIVEAHGGSISVESTQGRGSTFTVALPAA